MFDLTQLFSAVCGQHLDHTWAPGGIWLPFCQRCTGLYCAAGLAALAHLRLKPKPTARFLEVHGAFLLLMVPFGFHWLPQGPILRAVTGVLFGFAVVTFLWLPLQNPHTREPFSSEPLRHKCTRNTWFYALVLCSALLLIPCLGTAGGKASFAVLTFLGCCGAAALSMLILANTALATIRALRLLAAPAKAHTP